MSNRLLATILALLYSCCFLKAQIPVCVKDTDICTPTKPLTIALTRAWHLMGNYETITFSYNGKMGAAIKTKGSWVTYDVKTVALKYRMSYDSLFALLETKQIFTLEDQSKLSLKGTVDDGTNYTLSYERNGECRTYAFSNPDYYSTMNPELQILRNYITIVEITFSSFTEQ